MELLGVAGTVEAGGRVLPMMSRIAEQEMERLHV